MIALCWQAWRDSSEEITVAMNKGSHDVGMKNQHYGHHRCWDCLNFILFVGFCVLHSVDVGSAY